eukprot:3952884-Amphidinium_carterae.1
MVLAESKNIDAQEQNTTKHCIKLQDPLSIGVLPLGEARSVFLFHSSLRLLAKEDTPKIRQEMLRLGVHGTLHSMLADQRCCCA